MPERELKQADSYYYIRDLIRAIGTFLPRLEKDIKERERRAFEAGWKAPRWEPYPYEQADIAVAFEIYLKQTYPPLPTAEDVRGILKEA